MTELKLVDVKNNDEKLALGKKSKFDVFWPPYWIRFKIKACSLGLIASFEAEIPAIDTLPDFLKGFEKANELKDKKISEIICQDHIKLNWLDKIFRIKIENKIEKWAEKNLRKIKKIIVNETKAKEVESKFKE